MRLTKYLLSNIPKRSVGQELSGQCKICIKEVFLLRGANVKTVWLEVHGPEIAKLEDSVIPEEFEVVRPVSRTDKEEHLRLLTDAEFIVVGGVPITDEYIRAAKKLRFIQKWGVGFDNIAIETARELGIGVGITAGSNADAVAELAVGLMMATLRRISYVDRATRQGIWSKATIRPSAYMMQGKTVGMLGIGHIAQAAARKLSGFEIKEILYYDLRRLSPEKEKELNARYVDLDTLFRESDVLSLHVPLNKGTAQIVNAKTLSMMKPTSILINTARGGLVDEAALIDALKNKAIKGAGLDAFEQEPIQMDNPLLSMDNVVLSNHCGNSTIDSIIPMTKHVFDNLQLFVQGQDLPAEDVVVAPVKK